MSKPYIPKRFLGAFKAGHRQASREFIDEELSYLLLKKILASNWSDSESIAALDYLTKFNNEYHKAVIRKDDPEAFHNTTEMRRERYNANNAVNRDVVFKLRVDDTAAACDRSVTEHEDVLIRMLDARNKISF